MTHYEIWDDVEGARVEVAMPEHEAKAYAREHDPQGERLFLEDSEGNQLVWNANGSPPCWEAA